MSFLRCKKTILSLLVVSMLTSFFTPVVDSRMAPPVEAGGGWATEVGNAARSAIEVGKMVIENATAAADLLKSEQDWLKEYVLDPIAWTIMKILIQEISASVQKWIISGFDGSPAFIQNFEGMLQRAADEAVGEFIQKSEFGFVCDPFKLDVQVALFTQYSRDSARAPATCTLSGSVENIRNFANGAFADAGGWVSWHESTANPTNNAMGNLIDAEAKMRARIVSAQNSEQTQSIFNEGFNSKEFCALFESDVEAAAAGGGDAAPEDAPVPTARPSGIGGGSENCLQELVNTPGKAVFEFFDDSLEMPQTGAVVADEISEIVSTLLVQVSRMALQGSMGLLGLNDPAENPRGSGQSYLDDIGDELNSQSRPDALNQIDSQADATRNYRDAYQGFIDRVSGVIGLNTEPPSELDKLVADFPDCTAASNLQSTLIDTDTGEPRNSSLRTALTNARSEVTDAEELIDTVEELEAKTTNTPANGDQNNPNQAEGNVTVDTDTTLIDANTDLLNITNSGELKTAADVARAENDLDRIIEDELTPIEEQIQSTRTACQPDPSAGGDAPETGSDA